MKLRKYAEAGKRYDELLKKYPQRPDAEMWKVRRGLALSLGKQPAAAIAALEAALPTLKNKSAIAEAHYLIGASRNQLKQYDAAAKSLAAALQADPQGDKKD